MGKASLFLETEQQCSDIKRLVKSIQRSQGRFSLYFVECDLPQLRRELASIVAKKLAIPPLECDLEPLTFSDVIQLDRWIAHYARDKPADAAIFLFGMENLLPEAASEQRRLYLQTQLINWQRNRFARLNRPLIIWLPSYALNKLAEYAPDFYDWYSGIYKFSP